MPEAEENRFHKPGISDQPLTGKSKGKSKLLRGLLLVFLGLILVAFALLFFTEKSSGEGENGLKPEDGSEFSHITLVLADGEEMPLSEFPDKEFVTESPDLRRIKFIDIDGDGVPELMTEYYTGGLHCCVMYELFGRLGDNRYESFFTFEGGFNSLEIRSDTVTIKFFEQLGYFFACYACEINDELPNSSFTPSVDFIYKNKQLRLADTDAQVFDAIREDLAYLKKRPVPELDEFAMDDGTRKAFAERILTWFYRSDMDALTTRELFFNHYTGSDRDQVWKKIIMHAAGIMNMTISSKLKWDNIQGSSDKIRKMYQDTLLP